jgi:hypothetical protein
MRPANMGLLAAPPLAVLRKCMRTQGHSRAGLRHRVKAGLTQGAVW